MSVTGLEGMLRVQTPGEDGAEPVSGPTARFWAVMTPVTWLAGRAFVELSLKSELQVVRSTLLVLKMYGCSSLLAARTNPRKGREKRVSRRMMTSRADVWHVQHE